MKKTLYISAFTFLGILLQQLVHNVVEIWYIGLLIEDFDKYGFGWSWNAWFLIHHIGSVVLFLTGAFLGYKQGKYWWKRLYSRSRG